MNKSTTKTSTKHGDPSGNGDQSGSRFRLETPRRRVEVPQLLIAVFLVAVGALTSVVLFSRAAAREPVLVLAQPVEQGQVLVSDDLMVAYVATDDPINSVSPDAAAGLIGLPAVADLDTGTLLTPTLFVSRSLLDPGEGVIGMALAPGQYPTLLLAPGDRVDVVVTERGSPVEGSGAGGVIVTSAEVSDIAELGTQGNRFISLRMAAEDAAKVAAAAATGDIRLVLVTGTDR
jgi:Flp pilus assembly protein CpaB